MGAHERCRMFKNAVYPGRTVWVLNADGRFEPQTVIEVMKNVLVTEQSGELLFEDHGWLWRCSRPKDGGK